MQRRHQASKLECRACFYDCFNLVFRRTAPGSHDGSRQTFKVHVTAGVNDLFVIEEYGVTLIQSSVNTINKTTCCQHYTHNITKSKVPDSPV